MSLRVIAGSARGMKLKTVPGDATRPIMDRVKEALFSIIGPDIHDASFLDLFAGTGSVGIEALSRGAAFAHFNELDRRALATIRQNLARTQLASRARVSRRDAFALLSRKPQRHFHYIFIAPPQYKEMWLRALQALESNAAWHRRGCLVIAQIDPAEAVDAPRFQRLELLDARPYGRTQLRFYEFAPAEASEAGADSA